MWTSFRSTLDSYTSVLGRRFLALIWIGAIAAIIWIFGPRLSLFGVEPLAPVFNRLIAIGVIILGWALWTLISWYRNRKRDAALIDDIADSPEARAAAETKEEIDELRSRLRAAMVMMRKTVKRRYGYAYEFPWYLLMGAPGSGKTTLLTNSGLKFPLGDAMGAEPVQGVGGTRNCNWWFTDQAVLIDTAGRYTTQESGHERDKAGFLGFLSMLRGRRKSQPINGVILTLSLTDLMSQKPESRLRDVRAIRQRLAEIEDTLKARIPIYLVLTKADLLTGFSHFFEALGADGREQVWGMTFPLEETAQPGRIPEIFSREYRALLDRLSGLLLERLQQETDIDRRGGIFSFPAQVGGLHDALREVVEELSSGTEHVAEPLIRGVYFVSATQEEETKQIAGVSRSMNRSFFVARLIREVVLGEAALVSRDHRLSRRRRIATGLAYGGAAAVGLFLLASWTSSYFFNHRALALSGESLTRYAELAGNIPVREVQDKDFLRVLPALNALANVPETFEADEDETLPLGEVGFGLGQKDRIGDRFDAAYAEALGAYLLPRYMVALQDRLKTPGLSRADAFDTLKHYLSLAGLGPIDRDALLAQSEDLFVELYPGSGRAATRRALQEHMVAMLDRGELPVMAIDDELVAKTRETIQGVSLAQRAFDLLRTRPTARALPAWTPALALGPAGEKAFARASGAPLNQGIDGLFTRTGYLTAVLPQIGGVAEIAANEYWVRGQGAAPGLTASKIAEDATLLYWTEFSSAWRGMVTDLTIREVNGLEDAAELVSLIASQADPIGRLAADIAGQAQLVVDSEEAALLPVLPFDPLAAPDPYGQLRRALEKEADSEGAESNALTPLTPLYDAIYQQLGRVSATDARAAEIFAAESQLAAATQELVAAGRRLPAPLDNWSVGLAGRVASAAVARARRSVNALWEADGAKECGRAIDGRYPFDPNAELEVTTDDFSRIFGHDGLFDRFFKENMTEFVDTTTTPWSWKGGLGTSGEKSEALAQFERAYAIRTAFFPVGSHAPRVEVAFDLRRLDENARLALIQIGDQKSVHGLDRAQRRTLVWPSPTGNGGNASIIILPGEQAAALRTTGPWAPFRLLDQGDPAPVTDNQFDVRYRIDGREVAFRVTSGSVNNPFRLEALQGFSCPGSL
ncbi:MAG: type VI secretion system membrane subunit TssM [Pikeienuella sp.]